MKRRTRGRVWLRALFLLVLLPVLPPLSAQVRHAERAVELQCGPDTDAAITVELHTESGAPLVLHLMLQDPERIAERLVIDTGVARLDMVLPAQEEHSVTISPFAEPGVYDLRLEIGTAHGTCSREFRIGFMDFRWGRDNFRFGNNGSTTHGEVRPYSVNLLEWGRDRFGELSPVEEVAMIRRTYELFKGATGRCYAFSVSQARFMEDPGLLPSYYPHVYRVFAGASAVQRDMNRVQNDTVFQYFVAGAYDVHHRQSARERAAEVHAIMDRITEGRAAPFGYLGEDRHHSMLAYGFIHDPAGGIVQLVAANNWKEQQTHNLSSDDAELVLIRLHETDEESIRWLDEPIRAYRNADKIVFIDPDLVEPPAADTLAQMVQDVLDALRSPAQRSAIVVETVRSSMLVDGDGNRAGRDGGRRYSDIPGVTFRVHGENMVFEVSGELWDDLELVLHRLEREGSEVLPETRVALLDPGDPLAGTEAAARIMHDVSMNPAEPTRFPLRDLRPREYR